MRSHELGYVVEQIRFQRRDGLIDVEVGALEVAVHVDEVKSASAARVDEVAEPGQTGLASTVGDGRGGELGLARKRHHVLLVDLSSLLWRKVRLAIVVGLVGGEELSNTTGADEVLDGADPVGVLEAGVDAEGGHEGEGVVEADTVAYGTGGAPIGAPAGVLAANEKLSIRGLGVVVVDQTSLTGGGAAGGWCSARVGHGHWTSG